MLNRILVPLDGSTLAESALPVAARLARATGGTLLLVRAFQAVLTEFSPMIGVTGAGADEREASAYLARVRERDDLRQIAVETVALGGAVARAIVDAAAAYHADSIVLTTRGRSGVTRRALGSIAEHVVREAPVPVLVLRGTADELRPPAADADCVWRAVIGLDGSAQAEEALRPAAQLLRTLSGAATAELALVRIIGLPADGEHARTTSLPEAARDLERRAATLHAYLRSVAERLLGEERDWAGLVVRWAVIEAQDDAWGLIVAAEHPEHVAWRTPSEGATPLAAALLCHSTSLLALATPGGNALQRWADGGVVARVLEGTPLPVLLVRPSPPATPPTPPPNARST